MPTPSPAPGPRLSRRAVLAGLVGLGVAGVACTPQQATKASGAAAHTGLPMSSVDPDVALAAEALATQQQALDLLEATTDQHRDLSDELAPLVAAHKAHADLLKDAVPRGVSASPSPRGGAEPRRERVPGDRTRALARVVEAEQELVTVVKRQAFRAESGAFARLLASMAASAAQYATVLGAAAEDRRGS